MCVFANRDESGNPLFVFLFACFRFSPSFFAHVLVSLFLAVKLISNILVYFGSRQVFHGWGLYVVNMRGVYIY